MNLGSLRTETRNLLGDSRGTVWSDSRTNTAINQAIQNYAEKTMATYLEAAGTLGTDGLVTLPTDQIGVQRISTASGNLYKVTKDFVDRMDNGWITKTGTPKYWMMFTGSSVRSYPKPTVSTAVTVGYLQKPVDLVNDTDIPDSRVPLTSHIYLSYAASALLLLQDGEGQDAQKADGYMAKFNAFIGAA